LTWQAGSVHRSSRAQIDAANGGIAWADIEFDAAAGGAGLSRPHFYQLFRTRTWLTPKLNVNTLLME
jgi:hypothetical protein